ncbi:hypothetical protein [Micromonospora sp. NPDC048898]
MSTQAWERATALNAGVPFGWVTGDEVYGAAPGLRADLEDEGIGDDERWL